MRSVTRRRAPEHLATQVRKVEPIGGGMVRLYFAVEREGIWDDQVTILMPCSSIGEALGFAITAARAIAADTSGLALIPHHGMVS